MAPNNFLRGHFRYLVDYAKMNLARFIILTGDDYYQS